MTTPILEVADLHVAYGAVRAVKGVSLSVPRGGIVALIGANGAGKSTTLRAVSGLVPPSAGRILLAGRRIDGAGAPAVVAHGVALSPEGRRVFPRMTVYENLAMGAYLRRDRQEIRETLERIYGHFPILAERRRQSAGSLSGGEQQMLAIGRALMARPELLLLDEPSLGLAPMMVREIGRIVADINRLDGLSIVLVEQNAQMALRLCHHAYVLENGRITLEGTGQQLFASEYVRRAYLGA